MNKDTLAGFTPLPNWLIEEMPNMPPSVFQICVTIARQTLGYVDPRKGGRKEWDTISISQFKKATGLSHQGVINAVENGAGKWFERRKKGNSFEYRLVNSVDHSEAETVNSVDCLGDEVVNSVDRSVNSVDYQTVNSVDSLSSSSQLSRPKTVNSVDTQKKKERSTCIHDRVFARLQEEWLTVNPSQLENHKSLVERYGFDAWLAGFDATKRQARASVAYVEKVIISQLPNLPRPKQPKEKKYIVDAVTGERKEVFA